MVSWIERKESESEEERERREVGELYNLYLHLVYL